MAERRRVLVGTVDTRISLRPGDEIMVEIFEADDGTETIGEIATRVHSHDTWCPIAKIEERVE